MNIAPDTVNVLDHGYIKLVDYMGGDLAVVQAARTSHDAAERAGRNIASDQNLINYLMQHKHVSPFAQVVVKFEVQSPIFVARQWMRHWSLQFNEVSARYHQMDEKFYVPDPQMVGAQHAPNK